MKVKTYCILIEYTNIYGETFERELPCKSEKEMSDLSRKLSWKYKKDPVVTGYKVIPCIREG